MSLHTHQTIDGDTTAFKCYRSIESDGKRDKRGKLVFHDVVYVEIREGYTTPGWAGGSARRTTTLRLTREALLDLSRYFAQLAEHGEPDQSPQNKALREWVSDGMP